jgi:type II secretory pathway component GspD/PulD (secretin)
MPAEDTLKRELQRSQDGAGQPPETEPAAVEVQGSYEAAPPIYIMPGDGTVTIVCDDPEALEQFEKLFRMLSGGDGSSGQVGRNISIFELKNSDATEMADRLQALFGSTRSTSTWRRGVTPVSIVADERLNTIMVQGSRVDRETIEGLIQVLDSGQSEANKPQIIPVINVEAEEVADVVRDVFRSQLTATSTSRSSTSTSTSRSSRRLLPSVTVDAATNSLIVMAPAPLLEEIKELVNSLDQAAGENPARQVKIIPLTKASSTRVQEALDKILRSGSSRSPTASSRPR